nr:zygote arrest protein 1 [Dromaius novaehollandiae]
MAEEAMESYLYAAYHPYSYRYPPPKGKGGAAGGWRPRGGYFSGYGDTAAAAAAAEYFDNYQRAQLKAILSQVNPNLTPRLRKANTKEVGVQVNPRQDASVQCSLGPRTLLRRRPGPGPAAAPLPPEPEQEQGSPATTSTRAVRFPRTIAVYSPMASRRLTTFLEEPDAEPERRPQDEPPAAVEEEFCRTCQKSYNPYRVEDITCQSCKQTRCTCPVKMRHVDPKRPHRQDLCGRCKGKRLSCDSTFSFKYII